MPKTANGVLDFRLTVTHAGAQFVTATPGMASGAPGIPGTVLVMTAVHDIMGVNQSMFKAGYAGAPPSPSWA